MKNVRQLSGCPSLIWADSDDWKSTNRVLNHVFFAVQLESGSILCGVNPVATFKQKLEAKHLTVKMIFQD